MKKIIYISLVAAIILLNSCAQRFYSLNPKTISYSATNDFDDISLQYQYDILRQKGNKKMAKKEQKHNVKLVAVKITNNTNQIINIGENAAFFSNGSMVYPLDAITIKNNIKQSVPSHLWYLLLTPLTLTVNDSKPIPIGLVIGPGISGGNMLVAANANKKLYTELEQYDILNRNIQPGETVFGLVGFSGLDYAPLLLKLTK